MVNTTTVTDIQIIKPTTQVVVQTVLTGAWKTFRQGTGATVLTAIIALLSDWTTGAFGGNLPTIDDIRVLGFLGLAFVVGFFAALFSFVQNTWFAKTLPAGATVEAQVKP